MEKQVEKVDAASVDECAFRCVDCLIPFLRDAINNAIDDEDGLESGRSNLPSGWLK